MKSLRTTDHPASGIPHQLLERLPLQQICCSAAAKHVEAAPAPRRRLEVGCACGKMVKNGDFFGSEPGIFEAVDALTDLI